MHIENHFYYDNTNHFMRRQIAEFETNKNFEKRLSQLVSDLNNQNKDLLIEKRLLYVVFFYWWARRDSNSHTIGARS